MRLFSYAVLIMAALGAEAQAPVSASLSTDRAAVGETFEIAIEANGKDVSEPDLASALKDTGIQAGRPSVGMSTQVVSINGRMSTIASKSWRFPARATQEGTITIPRIAMTVDGQQRFTLPMQIRITQAAVQASPGGGGEGGGSQTMTVEKLAFVESSVDKTGPYQGEAVTLSLRIYAALDYGVQIIGPRTMPMPETQGFYAGPQEQANKTETRNGINYRVMEIKMVLYPTVADSLTIQPWSWQGEVNFRDGQFMRPRAITRDFLAPAIAVNVQPLPDRPEDFTGAVGKYRVKGALSSDKLLQGVPVVWTISVTGEGNPDAVGAPKIPAMTWAHVAGPEIDVQAGQGGQESVKVFRYTLTPLESGEQVVPAVKYVYFAPMLKNYKTESTQETKVSVTASPDAMKLVTAGGSRADARSSVELLNKGLLPIFDKPSHSLRPSPTFRSLTFGAGAVTLAFPPFAYLIFVAVLRHRRRLQADVRYARRHFALSRYRENMKRLSGDDPGETLYRAVAGYLSDLYNTVEAGLTSQDAAELLHEKGACQEVVDAVVSVLRACERVRYTGGRLTADEVDALAAAAELAVSRLQSGQRKGERP